MIDKRELVVNNSDLEAVPLPFTETTAMNGETGTTITLSSLDDRLNFPTAERLREILIYEMGARTSSGFMSTAWPFPSKMCRAGRRA